MFSGQEPHQKPKDVGNKLFQIPTTEIGCRKICSQLLLLFMMKPKTYDPPKSILCELIMNCLQMLNTTDHFHARPTKVNKQVGNLQLKYSQEIKVKQRLISCLPSLECFILSQLWKEMKLQSNHFGVYYCKTKKSWAEKTQVKKKH